MVAQNCCGSRKGHFKEFCVVTPDEMKHVNKRNNGSYKKKEASTYRGLYNAKSKQRVRESYHQKFVNQLKQSQKLEKELRETRRMYGPNRTTRAYIERNHKKKCMNCVKDVRYENKRPHNTRKELRKFEAELQAACKELKIKISNHDIFLKENKDKLIRNDSDV
jgi:hypothetical protein